MQPAWPPASKERHVDSSGYFSNRTIAALCTPTGGAICVVRVSGPDALGIAGALLGRAVDREDHRRATRGWIRDESGKKIDDAVWIPFFGPQSFTGEDTLELFLHGSPMIAQKVLDLVFRRGARLALPGEFSFRAVKNGKMRLSQAEAVKELVSAENDFSLDLALEKLAGSQHELVARIRADLLQLCTLSEAGIDFSDQDLDEVSLPRLKERLAPLAALLRDLRESFGRGQRFADGVPVTLFGLPNAGKSSFFNALLGEDRSIVSNIAGTTRDVVRERLNLQGEFGQVTLRLSDTAGLRQAGDAIEEIGIERTLKAAAESDVVVVVVDGKEPYLPDLEKRLSGLRGPRRRFMFVISKSDLLEPEEATRIRDAIQAVFGAAGVVAVSSKTLIGVGEAARQLADLAGRDLSRKPGEVVLTRIEHFQAVEKALDSLNRAVAAEDPALFAADLRHAMNDLGPLIGETVPDDILGKIFSDFCIGK